MDGRENWHKKIVMDGRGNWHKKIVMDGRGNWHKKVVVDGRGNWHKKVVMDGRGNWSRDGWPRKLAQENRDGLPRTVAKFDAGSPGRQSKHWAHELFDGLFGKLKRERAELRDGLPGKIEKVVTHEQKQVEKVVTYEQEKVEKIVKGSRRADGVLWRHRSHVATRRSHMRQSNMAKQFHPIMHNMHKPCCTVDCRLEGETKILNHEHVCSLSSLETQNNSGHGIHG